MKAKAVEVVAWSGYIVCGHAAIKSDGFTVVTAKAGARVKPVHTPSLNGPDRLAGRQEFANLSGCTITLIDGSEIKPKLTKVVLKKAKVYSFIKE